MRRYRHLSVLVVVAAAGPLLAQTNLLQNPSFDLPALPGGDCSQDTGPINNWTGSGLRRNGDQYHPDCPRDGDVAHLTLQGWGGTSLYATQTVTGLTPGQLYTLAGLWLKGHAGWGALNCIVELRDGLTVDSPLIGSKVVARTDGADTQWSSFSVNTDPGKPATGAITVVIHANNGGSTSFALHVDDLQLIAGSCFNPPKITDVNPSHGARGGTLTGVNITGQNFVAGSTSVKLTAGGQPDIVATNVVVTGANSLTCNFDLSAAVFGSYSVVVTVTGDGCPSDTLSDGFLVILPAFSNGSFELPTATGGCPVTPIMGVPTDWKANESALYGWDHVMFRDSDVFPPSCPPPDGLHYASSTSTNDGAAGAEAHLYQTFVVTPGTGYTLSGAFAGGGANKVTIELRDGDANALPLNTTTIHDGGPSYDWGYASVFGQPTGDMMTAVWSIDLNGAGPHAAHADALAVEICNTPLDLIGVLPNSGVGDGPITITNLSGSGFVLGGTPQVQLIKGNARITATDVTVISGNQITCKFDLTGATSGKYSLMVKQGGCSAVLPASDLGAFTVVAADFVNGDFENPDAAQNCGPPPTPASFPFAWNSDANLLRDGNAPVPPSCPSPASGHYASMGSDRTAVLRAWQTVRVLPGQSYTFSGWFAGPADSFIRLIDGDENGEEIASQQVVVGGGGGAWVEGSLAGTARTSVMTIMWEVDSTLSSPGGHADGLQFASNCNTIWADSDDDGDVDMDDFAFWQRCVSITGTSPSDPPYCRCFDRVAPYGQIDEADFPAFAHCVSGPGIPWTGCD